MNIEDVRYYCLSLKNVTEDMPWGDDVVVFRVEGKIFLAMSLVAEQPNIAVKCQPDKAIALRERYSAVTPAFHWNKKYWNNVYLQSDMLDADIKQCITDSYNEVVGKLPKTLREQYGL